MNSHEELIEEAESWVAHTKPSVVGAILRDMISALESVRAERDAALAAIERVRAAADTRKPVGLLAQDMIAALDGAPEPEWEWAVQVAGLNSSEPMYFEFPDPLAADRFIKNGALWYSPRPNGDPKTLVRRRKAGPWLPVGVDDE